MQIQTRTTLGPLQLTVSKTTSLLMVKNMFLYRAGEVSGYFEGKLS